MAKTLSEQQVLRLARLGALARLREIEEEARAIRRMFPGLKASPEDEGAPSKPGRKARKGGGRMSPEARRAAAERMKAYWARKKGLTSASSEASPEGAETAAETTRKPRGRKGRPRKRG